MEKSLYTSIRDPFFLDEISSYVLVVVNTQSDGTEEFLLTFDLLLVVHAIQPFLMPQRLGIIMPTIVALDMVNGSNLQTKAT